jgi:O-antigen ligase
MQGIIDKTGFRQRLRESLFRPETVIALIVTCGFLVNVQQGTDTNEILRDDPLVFKGIRVLTILLGGALAIFTVVKRRVPYTIGLTGVMLPFTLYFCMSVLSVPYSAYPLLSVFKVGELGLTVLICLIGITSTAGTPSDFFHLNVKIVLLYSIIIWVESFLFPSLAWIPLRGEMPLFGHALSGVFPVINGNTVGLFGAVLFLAYLPKLLEPPLLRPRYTLPALLGLASVVSSYSRISLLGLALASLVALVLLRQYALLWGLLLCLVLLGTSGTVRTLTIEHLARGQEDRSLDTFASHRLAMWDHVVSDYRVSVVGHGYAAGFRYDEDFTTGHAHNSLVEVYFNVGVLGVITWVFFMGAICSRLYRLLRAQDTLGEELISIVGVMIFLLIKALGSTVFVYLDASMLILAGIVIYLVRQHAAAEPDGLMPSEEGDPALSYL